MSELGEHLQREKHATASTRVFFFCCCCGRLFAASAGRLVFLLWVRRCGCPFVASVWGALFFFGCGRVLFVALCVCLCVCVCVGAPLCGVFLLQVQGGASNKRTARHPPQMSLSKKAPHTHSSAGNAELTDEPQKMRAPRPHQKPKMCAPRTRRRNKV